MSMQTFISLSNSMIELVERMQLTTRISKLSLFSEKFKNLPTLEVGSSISNLMEQIKNNSESAGTTLLSEGTPLAVVFDMEQYKLVNGMMRFIPSIIEKLRAQFTAALELKKIGAELLDTVVSPLNFSVVIMGYGAVCAIGAAFFLGKTYEKNQELKEKKQPLTSYLKPGIGLALSVCSIGFAILFTRKINKACLNLAKALRA